MADPIDPRFHETMNALAEALDGIFNDTAVGRVRKVGFVLLSFEFGKVDGGRVNYISNGARADMIAAMKEWIARAEGRVAVTPETPQ
jgi:hypothetical protein